MDRKTCYLAPVFDEIKFSGGVRVRYVKRNRKGAIKSSGTGYVSINYGRLLRVDTDTEYGDVVILHAKDVYHGKTNLEIIEEGGTT